MQHNPISVVDYIWILQYHCLPLDLVIKNPKNNVSLLPDNFLYYWRVVKARVSKLLSCRKQFLSRISHRKANNAYQSAKGIAFLWYIAAYCLKTSSTRVGFKQLLLLSQSCAIFYHHFSSFWVCAFYTKGILEVFLDTKETTHIFT